MKNHLRYILTSLPTPPMDTMKIPHVNNIFRAKLYVFVLPPETFKRWAKKTVWTKAILTRGETGGTVQSKFNE